MLLGAETLSHSGNLPLISDILASRDMEILASSSILIGTYLGFVGGSSFVLILVSRTYSVIFLLDQSKCCFAPENLSKLPLFSLID